MPEVENIRSFSCSLHMTSDGFVDKDGKWNCWKCYYSDEYFNPRGKILKELNIDEHCLRMVTPDDSDHITVVEVWKIDGKKHLRIFQRSFTYLSQAGREYTRVAFCLEKDPQNLKER